MSCNYVTLCNFMQCIEILFTLKERAICQNLLISSHLYLILDG